MPPIRLCDLPFPEFGSPGRTVLALFSQKNPDQAATSICYSDIVTALGGDLALADQTLQELTEWGFIHGCCGRGRKLTKIGLHLVRYHSDPPETETIAARMPRRNTAEYEILRSLYECARDHGWTKGYTRNEIGDGAEASLADVDSALTWLVDRELVAKPERQLYEHQKFALTREVFEYLGNEFAEPATEGQK